MTSKAPIGFLVMAAGHSRRFGSCKLTTIFKDNQTILQQVLSQISQINAPVVVATSSDRKKIIQQAKGFSCDVALLPSPSSGLGDSIAYAVQQTKHWAGWVICLGDMPWISAEIYQAVLDRAKQGCQQAAPAYEGKRGHPVFFNRSYTDALMVLKGDKGAASIIENRALQLFSVPDPGCLQDIDTPDHLP